MAYRQLCAVTFLAFGMVASACGGNTQASAGGGSSPETQPPSSSDQAPGTSDQAPSNSDQAPTSTDTPPGSADDTAGTGGSGRVGQLCQQVCSSVEKLANECSRGMSEIGMIGLCSEKIDCKVPVNFPCTDEVGDLLACFFENLALICKATPIDNQGSGGTDAFPAPNPDPPQNEEACKDAFKSFESCAERNNLTGDMGMMMQPRTCAPGVGCDGCPDECTKCQCEAGTDLTELSKCVERCPTP